MSRIRMLAMWMLIAGMGLAAWAQVSVTVDITNTAAPLLGAPIYEINTLVFTKNLAPIATFAFPSVSIAPGETKTFGPYSLAEEPNDLRVIGMKGPPGPYKTRFTAEFWLRPCLPLVHPQEKLRVHLKVVIPVVPIPIPPPELAAARSLDDGSYLLSTGISEAITRYAHLLGGTQINAAAAAWWGSGEKMVVVAPAAEIIVERGAIVGLLGIKLPPEMITGFYVMRFAGTRLAAILPPEMDDEIELVDLRGHVIARLPTKLRLGDLMATPRNRLPSPWGHIYTWQEPAEPGGKLKIAICIGYHKKNCDCIGIYIEF